MKWKFFSMMLAFSILLSACTSANLQVEDKMITTPIGVTVDARTIAGGFGHTLAIKADNSLWAWGNNSNHEIGNSKGGTYGQKILTPEKIMEDVVFVAAGNYSSYAIKANGNLWGWGNNIESKPVKIMEDVSAIAAGPSHTLAIKADGSLWSWGDNAHGKLGDGTTTTRSIPVKIMTGVIDVAAGSDFSLALKTDGSLWTWGKNDSGQLGDGTITTYYDKFEEKIKINNNKSKPVKIMDDVAYIAAGTDHSLAVTTDGSLWSWGWNFWGQLGDGNTISKLFPIKIMDDMKLLKSITEKNAEDIIDVFDPSNMPEHYFIAANDKHRIFVRERADIKSNIMFIIESGEKDLRLKDMGDKILAEAYV